MNRHNWRGVRERVLEFAGYNADKPDPPYKEYADETNRFFNDLAKRWGASVTTVGMLAAGSWREYIGSRTGIEFDYNFGAVAYDTKILARRRSEKMGGDEDF